MKRIIASILLFAMMLVCAGTALAVRAASMQSILPEEKVAEFFKCINDESWDSLGEMYCSSAKSI